VTATAGCHRAVITIGGISIGVDTSDQAFLRMLQERYAGFVESSSRAPCDYEFDIDLGPPRGDMEPEDDIRVLRAGGRWRLERGDFCAEWDPATGRGRVRQSANPYAIDAVLRIVHTLVLAKKGGLLMHAASAIRNNEAFVFAGVSGAGKTTLARMAPADVHLLSDEISYVRREDGGYWAYGTPFAGELAKSGENMRAPLAAIYLLVQGRENRIAPIGSADAARGILTNTLFFARDVELVQAVFMAALDLAQSVPVSILTFVREPNVWELIGRRPTTNPEPKS
jgi:hypothetical protein